MDGAADLAAKLQHTGALITVLNGPDIHLALEAAEIPHEYDPEMDALVALLGQSNAGLGVLVAGLGDFSIGGLDVGTHALVRAAAVHYEHICVVVDPEDFEWLLDRVLPDGGLSVSQKQKRDLAAKAFRRTAALDTAIAEQLSAAVDEQVAVLVVGGGGREHAIAARLADSDSVARVFVAPGNGGTATASPKIQNVDISVKDETALVRFAQERDIGLVVVGPEVGCQVLVRLWQGRTVHLTSLICISFGVGTSHHGLVGRHECGGDPLSGTVCAGREAGGLQGLLQGFHVSPWDPHGAVLELYQLRRRRGARQGPQLPSGDQGVWAGGWQRRGSAGDR
eukprot:scaffold358_cov256-Pinguiococcus_pyrenoidosus.AAC.6